MSSDTTTRGPNLQWQDENGVAHRLSLTDKIFLGRVCRGIEREKCILVPHPRVSRDHAVVRLTRHGAEITDLSKNGTWVNAVRMAPGASRQLQDGDVISLGGRSIRISLPNLTPQPESDNWMEQTAIIPTAVCITSLVADVRGFSAFSQKTDSTVVYTLIEAIFSRFSTIVSAHQGTVKDYAGDAVFAFWEHTGGLAPEHALSACQAAIDQLHSVPEIHRQLTDRGLAMPLPVLGWGLTTGQITLSHYGSRSAGLALVGDCINLAFRLSSMANKTLSAPIVMCRQTASLVEWKLPLMDLGEQEVRGRSGKEHLMGIHMMPERIDRPGHDHNQPQ
ncbi:adenylate/guanylate cyclase domain-containing protein [Desulfosarcina sp.]|uniref:adenylate/guanylate cyclase domain-containing protein n=1 Tax=Desulfosarcina sp. TaxID=2027861 RepID=UPI0039704E41